MWILKNFLTLLGRMWEGREGTTEVILSGWELTHYTKSSQNNLSLQRKLEKEGDRKTQKDWFISRKCQVCFAFPTYLKKAYIFNCQLLFLVKFKKCVCKEDYQRKQRIALWISGSLLLSSVSSNPLLGKSCLKHFTKAVTFLTNSFVFMQTFKDKPMNCLSCSDRNIKSKASLNTMNSLKRWKVNGFPPQVLLHKELHSLNRRTMSCCVGMYLTFSFWVTQKMRCLQKL